MSKPDAAVHSFDSGHSCSQAVLLAFAPDYGIPLSDATRVSAGFGGGMQLGSICGAVTGAIMVLGLSSCSDCSTGDGRSVVNNAAEEFRERFTESMGSLDCPGVLGCDIRTPEGAAKAKEEGLFSTRCTSAVREAATILDEMLSR